MYGAILGDIIGSPYEFDFRNIKTKDFPLFSANSMFTDDTVMTIAVADAFLDIIENGEHLLDEYEYDFDIDEDEPIYTGVEEARRKRIVDRLLYWGDRFPNAGYGTRFYAWLNSDNPEPYNSFGNGSAMRVSSVAWLFDDVDTVRWAAELSAEVTHNHPEGIKGAEATAAAIFLSKKGASKEYIKDYIVREFDYDLSRTCDEIRPTYHHVESCQETVPEAIIAFLEGNSFEDVIRTAVSLGGDSDTLTCIAGSIAEAFYGIPELLKEECLNRLPESMKNVLHRYEEFLANREAEIDAYCAKLPILKTRKVRLVDSCMKDGVLSLGYYLYDDETKDWMDRFYKYSLIDYYYKNNFERIQDKEIDTFSRDEVLTYITYILRIERFNEGILANCIEKGIVERLCKRLHEVVGVM